MLIMQIFTFTWLNRFAHFDHSQTLIYINSNLETAQGNNELSSAQRAAVIDEEVK